MNEDFGLIFNDLLPGNTAKLDPPEGKEISDGLEVKVCLGKVWKQSLTELSGGQRYVLHSSSPYDGFLLTYHLQISHRPLPHPVSAPVLACANVHPGRSRCCSGSLTYSEYRTPDPDSVQGQPVHCCQVEGRHVRQRQSHFQDQVYGRHQCCSGVDAGRYEVIVVQVFANQGVWELTRAYYGA